MAIVKKISELTPKGSALANTDLLIVGVDNGTDYDLKSITGAQVLGNVVSQTITDGVTAKAPSENVVYDSLALKVDKVAGKGLSTEDYTSAEKSKLSGLSGTNTGDQTLQTVTDKGNITTKQIISTSGVFLKTVADQVLSSLYSTDANTKGALLLGDLTGSSTFYKLNEITVNSNSILLPSSAGTLALTSDLTNKVNSNTAITGATKTKITYDSKGLVTSGADATTADIADSLNKRYVTDTNLTVIGNTSGTNTGDQIISDATLTTTDITTNNFSTTKHGFVPKGTNVGNFLKDDGTWGTPASGSSSGIWGIANASGVYTYYATWSLAVASATSGQVIELFADITETTVSYILKNGVNVNGNGHTITFSNSLNGFDDNNVSCTVVFSDINLVKTQNLAYAVIQCFNASSNIGGYNTTINVSNASGYGFFGCGVIWGFRIIGTGCAILTKNSASLSIDKCYILSYVDGYPASTTTYNDCYIKSTTNSVRESPTMNNCIVISTGGSVYSGNSRNITNCTLISMTSNVISGSGYFENCYIFSAANTAINTSSLSEFHNCYIESATQYLNVFGTSAGSFFNCTLKTNLNPVFYGGSPKIYNSNLINTWNSASGRITEDCTNVVIVKNYILVANSSAFVNYSGASKTIYMYGNAIKGTSNINSALITNGQTNTADAQGNVILN